MVNEEITEIPEGPTVIATGPLTSPDLSAQLKELTGEDYFYFYDAADRLLRKTALI